MNDWRCYSTADMVNWTDHGAILHYTEFEWSRGDAWAGQCVERNGKFYFYVPISKKGGWNAVGVAVADSPTGPFKDPLGHPLVETGTGISTRRCSLMMTARHICTGVIPICGMLSLTKT